jgi:hypothetical protein
VNLDPLDTVLQPDRDSGSNPSTTVQFCRQYPAAGRVIIRANQETTMNTKLLLQVLLTLGCLALAVGVLEVVAGQLWLASAKGWWEGAIACWLLIVAIRTVYPVQAK